MTPGADVSHASRRRGIAQVATEHVASLLARRARSQPARVGTRDLEGSVLAVIRAVEPYTVASAERVAALCASVDYVVDCGIPGAFVECGLWRGGSLLAVLLRLHQRGVLDREVVGYDTFTGMTEPTREDADFKGRPAGRRPRGALALDAAARRLGRKWPTQAGVSRDEVHTTLTASGYPGAHIHLVQGPIEETLPDNAPDTLALLRLDTGWYASTRHELEHLYPRLAVGGVLIVNDYGHYRGSRKAVDECLNGHRIFLQRLDYSARLAVKQEDR
jgi:hypothetical protein